jgi:uncharacterized membrane protein HdeD (DUF308 family)
MKAIKNYGWVLQIVGASLLIGLALYLEFANGDDIVVPFIGALIILSACVRLVPFVKTQKNDLVKTINIIEITIDVAIGITLIVVQMFTEIEFNSVFGYLIGVYLMLRGSVHFFGISEKEEQSDLPLYLFHIAALIVGSYVFFSGDFTPGVLIHLILAFSVISGGYLIYTGYKGYRSYRYQKTLNMPDFDNVSDQDTVEKRVPATNQPVAEKEERIEEHVS